VNEKNKSPPSGKRAGFLSILDFALCGLAGGLAAGAGFHLKKSKIVHLGSCSKL